MEPELQELPVGRGAAPADGFDADPDLASPMWKLDEPLFSTLKRSFVDRMRKVPGAEQNLDVAWYAPGNAPRTTWEALTCLGAIGLNVIVRVYRRMEQLDRTGELWRQIKYIRNHWFGGSAGFKVVWEDPAAATACLDARLSGDRGRRVARDLLIGGIEHQLGGKAIEVIRKHGFSPLHLLSPHPPPDADTWREVDTLGKEGLHFCIGKHASRPPELDDIHIDWSSPVRGIDAKTGRLKYDLGITGVFHYLQAMTGLGKPLDTFDETDRLLAEAERELAGRGAAGALVEERELLQRRWSEVKWRLAVNGKTGYDESVAWYQDARDLVRRTRARAPVGG